MSNNKQLVLDFYKAFDTKGVEAAAAYLASNFKTEVPGTPGTLDINGYRQFMTMFKTAFPDVYHVFENTVAEGDKVVTIGYFAGTHTGEMMGIPPTGKQVRLGVIHFDRVENGKIVYHKGEMDMMSFMQQLGVVPASQTT